MAAAKSRNWFAIGVAAAVVVVLAGLGALVVWMNNEASAPGVTPEASAVIDPTTGAIMFGEGDTEIDVYLDFMCPICGDFEQVYGEDLQSAAAANDITLSYHPISILDARSQGTEFSSRAAGSMYCVAESAPDRALDYLNLMFANQPQEGGAAHSDEQLVGFAEQVGAGAASACIVDRTYFKFVNDVTPLTPPDPDSGRIGTPTVVINGERILNAEIPARFAPILASGSAPSN